MQCTNGEKVLAIGTAKEIAKQLNVEQKTVYFWSRQKNIKRDKGNAIVAIEIEEETEDEIQ